MERPATTQTRFPRLVRRVEEHHAPDQLEYVRIAVILAIITALEVALYYPNWPKSPKIVGFVILAATKFAIVAAFFMHLKFDWGKLYFMIVPAMILGNHKTTYPTLVSTNPLQYYTPANYGNVYLSGFPITIRNALANSINIPAIDAIEFAGIQNVVNMSGRLGLTEIASKPLSQLGPSMAIGASEVSLLHLTGAYAAFADQGTRVPQTSILEITNSQGQLLYKFDQAHPHGVQAVRPDVAFLMSALGLTTAPYNAESFDFTGNRGNSPAGPFQRATTELPFLLAVAQGAEDTGVRAYKGQAGNLISNRPVLESALRIHSVEARHASKIRRMRRIAGGAPSVVKYSGTVSGGGAAAAGVSNEPDAAPACMARTMVRNQRMVSAGRRE